MNSTAAPRQSPFKGSEIGSTHASTPIMLRPTTDHQGSFVVGSLPPQISKSRDENKHV